MRYKGKIVFGSGEVTKLEVDNAQTEAINIQQDEINLLKSQIELLLEGLDHLSTRTQDIEAWFSMVWWKRLFCKQLF